MAKEIFLMIGLVLALPQELEAVRIRLGPSGRLNVDGLVFYYASVDGQPVVLTRSGIGRNRSKGVTESMLRVFNVDAVVSAGLAGGVKDGVRVSELIIASSVSDYTQVHGEGMASASYPCHRGMVELACGLARQKGLEFHCGDLLTVEEVVAQPGAKRRIGSDTSAVAIDMEGAGVAQAASVRKKPFLAIKVLSDEVEDKLKVTDLVDEEGRVRMPRVFSFITGNLQNLTYLFSLRHKTTMALDRLALFLPDFVKRCGETQGLLHMDGG